MRVMSWTRPCHGVDWSHSLFYLTLLLWTRRMNGLADFSSKMMTGGGRGDDDNDHGNS